jgi:VWFA-related protein
MTGNRWRWLACVTCAALFAVHGGAGVSAQRPVSHETGVDAAAATGSDPAPVSIRINAIVTDRRGRPIVDLKPSDFELQDNGVDQKIESAVLKAMPPADSAPGSPIRSAEDEQHAAREPDTRLFAIYLDEFHVADGLDSVRVRDEVTRFVDTELRPRDLLFVLKTLDPVGGIRFVRDRETARATIRSFAGRKGDYAPRSSFEEQFFGRTPEAVESARGQVVITALRELAMRMGELEPTRAALLVVTEDFARDGGGARQRRLPDWQGLSRIAGHFNFPIYTFDPREQQGASPAHASDQSRSGDQPQMILQGLAAQTGGEASLGGPAFASTFTRMSRDLDAYYVLTYQPSQATDGRFHPIQVRSKRKDAQIRVPTGYWSPLSSEWRAWLAKAAAPPAPSRPPRVLKRSPLIDTWIGFERGSDGRMRLVFTWDSATTPSATRRPPPHTVVLKATTPADTPIVESEVEAVRAAPEPGESRDRLAFEVPAGRIQIDLTILGADGSTLDTAARDIDVPAARGTTPVILPVQIVRARTARDFRMIVGGAVTAPSPAREFSRTERLLIRTPAFDPAGAPITVTGAIVNSKGQRIREIARLASAATSTEPEFDLPLGWLAPGDYGIEISVVGGTGSTRQLVPIRITG